MKTADRLVPELSSAFVGLLRGASLASCAVEGPAGSGGGPPVGFPERAAPAEQSQAEDGGERAAAPPATPSAGSATAAAAPEEDSPDESRRRSGREGSEGGSREARRGRSPTARRGRRGGGGDADDDEGRGRGRAEGRRGGGPAPSAATSEEAPPSARSAPEPSAGARTGAGESPPPAAEPPAVAAPQTPPAEEALAPREWSWGALARDPLQNVAPEVLAAVVFGRTLAEWCAACGGALASTSTGIHSARMARARLFLTPPPPVQDRPAVFSGGRVREGSPPQASGEKARLHTRALPAELLRARACRSSQAAVRPANADLGVCRAEDRWQYRGGGCRGMRGRLECPAVHRRWSHRRFGREGRGGGAVKS